MNSGTFSTPKKTTYDRMGPQTVRTVANFFGNYEPYDEEIYGSTSHKFYIFFDMWDSTRKIIRLTKSKNSFRVE
jgi:hypothetical protein